MKQSAFNQMRLILQEAKQAFDTANDNGGCMNCDLAAYIAQRFDEIHRVLKSNGVEQDKLAGLIRHADHRTPLHYRAHGWNAYITDYLDGHR